MVQLQLFNKQSCLFAPTMEGNYYYKYNNYECYKSLYEYGLR